MGTLTSVTLVAYGDQGHTDLLLLVPADPNQRVFQPGSTDEFKVDLGKDIGPLYKIRVGHDSWDANQGWFLERVRNIVNGGK